MTTEVSNIRIGLTIAFAIAILAIIAELCYVLWRRRRFRRQHLSGESDINNNNNNNNNNNTSSNSNSNSNSVPSKELLYFFCWKSQLSRIEPADGGGGGAIPVFHSATTYHDDDPQEPIDLLKLQEMYGPSRVLFTIKEEEKEEETEHHQYFSDDQKSSSIEKEKKRVCLKNWFEDAKTETEGEEEESPVMVVVNIDEMVDFELETPFSTPCASPPYYTPTPSPSRHGDQVSVVEEEEEEEEEEEQVQTTDRNLTHTVTIEADV